MELGHYTAMTLLSVLTAMVLMVLIGSNVRLKREKKILFSCAAVLLALGTLAEYAGVRLDGSAAALRGLHVALKVFELSLSPFLVYVLIAVCNGLRSARFLLAVAAGNLALEIVSGFTGLLYYVDAGNVYHHNTLYPLYTAVYVLCGIYFFYSCGRFSEQYQNRGGGSLFAILAFLFAGLSVHAFREDVRADWLTLTIAYALFYIYYTSLVEQMDSLTRLLDRKSYDTRIAYLHEKAMLIVFDVDSFKEVNDTYGHEAGDACLVTIGALLKRVYGRSGLCYRIGGDEFCAILPGTPSGVEKLNARFCACLESARLSGRTPHLPRVSLGYAQFDPRRGRIAEVLQEADEMMYRYKKEHHGLLPPQRANG